MGMRQVPSAAAIDKILSGNHHWPVYIQSARYWWVLPGVVSWHVKVGDMIEEDDQVATT
jgi:hypothetical protein